MRSLPSLPSLVVLAVVAVAGCSNAADPIAPDARPPVDAPDADAPPPLDTLRVNEVVAAGAPDWIEVVNVSGAPLELSDYCYVDTAGDLAKCAAFPAGALAPGAYHVQDVASDTSGFALGGDEEVWIYRIADGRLVDGVDWDEGDAPANQSFARLPDTTGAFARTNVVTRGAANLPSDATEPLRLLVINEVAAAEDPDWLEVVNATAAPLELSEFCYLDSGPLAACHPFPAGTLAPGAYFAADASAAVSGFAFGGDEAAYVYRIADQRLSDSVDWPDGAAGPAGSSYARSPNITGPFATTTTQTRGAPNP